MWLHPPNRPKHKSLMENQNRWNDIVYLKKIIEKLDAIRFHLKKKLNYLKDLVNERCMHVYEIQNINSFNDAS